MSKALDRRTFLRGAGTAVALPLLDAMMPAFSRAATASKAPCRMAFVYVPNGIVMNEWIPRTQGEVARLPEVLPRLLEPLAPYREDIMVMSGLTQNGGRALGDGPGDHGRAGANYLTAVHPKKTFGKDIQTGVSVDQIAAQRLVGKTRFASLELGCEQGIQGGNCDNGYSCAYSNSISWRTPAAPNPPEVRPRAVFERLFGGADVERDPVRRARQQRYDRSILDLVLDDAGRLKNTLGGADRRKLDDYLSAIRDIETRIQSTGQGPTAPVIENLPQSIPADFAEHSRLMFDLMTLAFQADATRVVTVMLAIEQSNRPYREIGIAEAHHGLTHHRGDPEKIEKVARINRYHVEQFAYLLSKLKATPDGEGTLLDHVMVTYGSGLADGNRHDHHNLPTVLAGRASGGIRPAGRHVRYPDETPMANLFVAMLDRMGVPVESLGDSNGKVGYLAEL
ncbi:MAG: DUF1552 domain-containing protein [Bryobacteraceae bacterium]